jgi:hypothetical protein
LTLLAAASLPETVRYLQTTLLLLLAFSCASPLRRDEKPRVILAYQDKAKRCAILLRELQVAVKIQPMGDLPYSSNASAAIWVGKTFPFTEAIEVIKIARRYYDDLRYVALSDYGWNPPGAIHREIFVGGSTEAALKLKLKAWTDSDFSALEKVKSQEEFNAFIVDRHKGDYPVILEEKADKSNDSG